MKKYKPTYKFAATCPPFHMARFWTTQKPQKSLTHGFKRSVGRNNQGEVTTRHKGAGHKRLFREVDFRYDKINIPYVWKQWVWPKPHNFHRPGSIPRRVKKICPRSARRQSRPVVFDFRNSRAESRQQIATAKYQRRRVRLQRRSQTAGRRQVWPLGRHYLEVVAKDAGMVDIKMPSSEIHKVKETAWLP